MDTANKTSQTKDEQESHPLTKPSPLPYQQTAHVEDDGVPSESFFEQLKVERDCKALYCQIYENYLSCCVGSASQTNINSLEDKLAILKRRIFDKNVHIEGLKNLLTNTLPNEMIILDSSRTWIVYWAVHSLHILDSWDNLDCREQITTEIFKYLKKCQLPSGGFGGGPGQIAHLATTYAAVAILAEIGTEESMSIIDRQSLKSFLISTRSSDGGYLMHDGGEADMRGVYCAIAAAAMTRILCPELIEGVGEYVSRCQRYDGGIAGEVGAESHAGYTYCGLAALTIIGNAHKHLDIKALARWCAHRQMPVEGGFHGRPNKLVDACYSFWVAATCCLIKLSIFTMQENAGDNTACLPQLSKGDCFYSPTPLMAYLIFCCQPNCQDLPPRCPLPVLVTETPTTSSAVEESRPEKTTPMDEHKTIFGFRDKPRKQPDYYHTAYALSGMSLTMEWCSGQIRNSDFECLSNSEFKKIFINSIPKFVTIDPIYNISTKSLSKLDSVNIFNDVKIPPGEYEMAKFRAAGLV